MKWLQLLSALLPIAEEVYKAITDAIAAGKSPADVHQAITDHMAQLPAQIRSV